MPVNGDYAEDGSIEKEIAERIVQLRRLVRKIGGIIYGENEFFCPK